MLRPVKTTDTSGKFMKYIMAAIILTGIIVRIVLYFQNRNLIIDEANIARNLYERDFGALVRPLSYEQYAPPVFLWIEKLLTGLFGFREYVLRLYPLFTGIASLPLFYLLLKKLMPLRAAWFPMILFAASFICIRYSSEAKQYMPDVFISLFLPWLALSIDIHRRNFVTLWLIAGSVAIWSSMPSVFVLAGVGVYYGWICLKQKDQRALLKIMLVSTIWLAQFVVYYLLILKPQADSSYLQQFHQENFLFATPGNAGEWMHNWSVINALLWQFGDHWPFVITIYTALLLAGAIKLFCRNAATGLLLTVPLGGLMIAAALNQFSLLPRVALFSLPLFILLIGYGFATVIHINVREWKLAMIVLALYASASNIAKSVNEQYKYEQLTDGLDHLQQVGIDGAHLYLHHASGPAFLYYTGIHPNRDRYVKLVKGCRVLNWDTYYSTLSQEIASILRPGEQVGFVFTNAPQDETDIKVQNLRMFLRQTEVYQRTGVNTYLFGKY